MRAIDKTQALFFGTLAVGAGVLAIAAIEGASRPLAMLALLGAAAVVTELIEVPSDEHSLDPADAHPFSFSSTVHLATVMILGAARRRSRGRVRRHPRRHAARCQVAAGRLQRERVRSGHGSGRARIRGARRHPRRAAPAGRLRLARGARRSSTT